MEDFRCSLSDSGLTSVLSQVCGHFIKVRPPIGFVRFPPSIIHWLALCELQSEHDAGECSERNKMGEGTMEEEEEEDN